MILFLTLFVSAAAFNKAGLKSGLQSTEGQVKLFQQWAEQEHAHYSAQERSFRFRVFRKHLQEIVAINDAQDMYELDANFMAGLTKEEQQQWYGINITALPAEKQEADDSVVQSSGPAASSKFWREEGKVTPVKNQKSCGSCWAFGAIVAFEGHYAIKTGGLKRFSEQELLDCTYEGRRDGCDGGWYWQSFDMIKRTQHLALDKDYPYVSKDGRCQTNSKPNGMIAARFVQTMQPGGSKGDASLVQALNEGPVAMAFEVKGGFNYYKNGILSIYNCGGTPHHAMGVTGYTPEYFEIKNSWGTYWGDNGYVRFNRKIENMCGISNWLSYPKLEKTGDDSDDVTPTKGDDGDDDSEECVDKDSRCEERAGYGDCKKSWRYMSENCPKSCKICGCQDGIPEDCPRWKTSGYCTHTHVEFMNYICKKTCGHCTDDVTPTKDDDGDDDGGNCADKYNRCKEWADRGECDNSWAYMSRYCPKSCELCGSGCKDVEPESCPYWKQLGYCTHTYVDYMKSACKKTCGNCTDDGEKKCPGGLKFCDGKCQHEHFCH